MDESVMNMDMFIGLAAFALCAFWFVFVAVSKKADDHRLRMVCAGTGLLLGVIAMQSVWDILGEEHFDNETPFAVVHDLRVLDPVVRPGEVVRVEYEVTIRPGCTGSVTFRAKPADARTVGSEVLSTTLTTWPSGRGTRTSYYRIPDRMDAGERLLFWQVSGDCVASDGYEASGPRRPLRSRSPYATVIVVDPES